jgi:AcrR family transcriptional regulator
MIHLGGECRFTRRACQGGAVGRRETSAAVAAAPPGVPSGGPSGAPSRAEGTRQRLLDAAEALLREGGLAAATVPAIAARAGLSVGIVYKRFPDKDALLREVFARWHARATAANARALDRARWRGAPIGPLLASLLTGTVRAYAANRRLYGAVVEFVEAHPDERFRRRMERLRRAALHDASLLLLDRRADMGHPDPARGVAFVLTSVACTLRGVLLAPRPPRRYLADPDGFAAELAALVLSYLQLPADSRGGR